MQCFKKKLQKQNSLHNEAHNESRSSTFLSLTFCRQLGHEVLSLIVSNTLTKIKKNDREFYIYLDRAGGLPGDQLS